MNKKSDARVVRVDYRLLCRIKDMLAALSDLGLLDELCGEIHPDEINAVCDAVSDLVKGKKCGD